MKIHQSYLDPIILIIIVTIIKFKFIITKTLKQFKLIYFSLMSFFFVFIINFKYLSINYFMKKFMSQ